MECNIIVRILTFENVDRNDFASFLKSLRMNHFQKEQRKDDKSTFSCDTRF